MATSDAAGDVVAVGEGVDRVKIGDRVTPVFAQTFLHGDHNPDYQKNGLGGGIDGVLAQYFLCDQVRLSLRRPSHARSLHSAEWTRPGPLPPFLRRSLDSTHRRRDGVALSLRPSRRRSPPRPDRPRSWYRRSLDLRCTARHALWRRESDCYELQRREARQGGGGSWSRLPRWCQLPECEGLG